MNEESEEFERELNYTPPSQVQGEAVAREFADGQDKEYRGCDPRETEQQIPKWFDGDVYEEGGIVENPFSGQKYTLTAKELSIYDFIIGCQLYIETMYGGDMFDPRTASIQRDMAKGLTWFRKVNPKAYMVLLDQMKKLIWKLYNENRISMEVALELLDKYYE